MSGFLAGLFGIPGVVGLGLASLRVRRDGDPLAPGRRRALREGCTCPRWRNWFGFRGVLWGTQVIRRGCPVLGHTRMYKDT